MRKALVLAKLIPDTTAGHSRLSFVTEGEASLYYAVHSLPMGVMDDGEGVVIVDAGGSTIDISSYSKNIGEAKHRFEEVAAPQCNFLFSQLDFQNSSITHRLFSWIGLHHSACLIILREWVILLLDIYNTQCGIDYLQKYFFGRPGDHC